MISRDNGRRRIRVSSSSITANNFPEKIMKFEELKDEIEA
ncbi:unnamed protein product [Arabidopsis halleri]